MMIPCIRRPTWSSSVVVGVEHGLAGPILQAVNQKGWREVRGRHPRFHAPHVAQRLPTAWQKPAERWRILGVSRLAKPGLKALDHPNAPRDLPVQLLDPQAWTEGVDLPPQGQTEPKSRHRYAATLLCCYARLPGPKPVAAGPGGPEAPEQNSPGPKQLPPHRRPPELKLR